MKNSRNWLIWATLAICAALVIGAMTWLTRSALDSERERTMAEQKADLEERTRLALWRMDSEGTALLLAENRQPSRDYDAIPSTDDSFVQLRFESSELGQLKSAQDKDKLEILRDHLSKNPLPLEGGELLRCVLIQNDSNWNSIQKEAPVEKERNLKVRRKEGSVEARKGGSYQTDFSNVERAQRAKAVDNATEASSIPKDLEETTDDLAPSDAERIDTGSMRSVWIGNELFLLRQLSVMNPALPNPVLRVQGAWIDAAAIREHLLVEAADLFPDAKLIHQSAPTEITSISTNDPLALVSFPFILQRNENISSIPVSLSTPLKIGWIAVIVAIAAVALLVRGIMRLSERRASFVSAVTHELRTPLTTFQLYSDMLQSGAVREEKRGDYFLTLHREAGRLSHLVENVLAFSGIERGSARGKKDSVSAKDLLAPMLKRFEDRLLEVGLDLIVDFSTPSWNQVVRTDRAAAEHVLFNLIDNAAKYAHPCDPAKIELTAAITRSHLAIHVRDHGPGIAPPEQRRIFRAFHKSAATAAETKPGVGLGLALSRRLARAGGGDLTIARTDAGCCFVLTLPLVRE